MFTQTNKALTNRLLEEVFTKGNLEVVDELVAPDFVHHNPPPGMNNDREGLKQMVTWIQNVFPDSRYTLLNTVAEEDKVVHHWLNQAMHRGEFMGVPPTGKEVKIRGVSIYRIVDGKIAELWDEVDILGVMQQIGAIPAPT